MSAAPEPTVAECIAELERELKMRRGLYPRWADAGKLPLPVGARRILILERIIERFLKPHLGPPTQGGLGL